MEKSLNVPYVVRRNKLGETVNPIDGSYMSMDPNRKARRQYLQKDRFFGNGKNTPLTVLRTGKYLRFRQKITLKGGSIKTILHYIVQ